MKALNILIFNNERITKIVIGKAWAYTEILNNCPNRKLKRRYNK